MWLVVVVVVVVVVVAVVVTVAVLAAVGLWFATVGEWDRSPSSPALIMHPLTIFWTRLCRW